MQSGERKKKNLFFFLLELKTRVNPNTASGSCLSLSDRCPLLAKNVNITPFFCAAQMILRYFPCCNIPALQNLSNSTDNRGGHCFLLQGPGGGFSTPWKTLSEMLIFILDKTFKSKTFLSQFQWSSWHCTILKICSFCGQSVCDMCGTGFELGRSKEGGVSDLWQNSQILSLSYLFFFFFFHRCSVGVCDAVGRWNTAAEYCHHHCSRNVAIRSFPSRGSHTCTLTVFSFSSSSPLLHCPPPLPRCGCANEEKQRGKPRPPHSNFDLPESALITVS